MGPKAPCPAIKDLTMILGHYNLPKKHGLRISLGGTFILDDGLKTLNLHIFQELANLILVGDFAPVNSLCFLPNMALFGPISKVVCVIL